MNICALKQKITEAQCWIAKWLHQQSCHCISACIVPQEQLFSWWRQSCRLVYSPSTQQSPLLLHSRRTAPRFVLCFTLSSLCVEQVSLLTSARILLYGSSSALAAILFFLLFLRVRLFSRVNCIFRKCFEPRGSFCRKDFSFNISDLHLDLL